MNILWSVDEKLTASTSLIYLRVFFVNVRVIPEMEY